MHNYNLNELPSYKDERGSIQMVLENCDVKSISKIYSNGNTVRARHWHKKDGHFILVNFGQIDIYERSIHDNSNPVKTTLVQGDVWFTGPEIVHEMYFPIPTFFDCYSLLPRDSSGYEKDTVRVDY